MNQPRVENGQTKRCSLCCGFTLSAIAGGSEYMHHENIAALRKSVADRCDLCSLIWHALSDTSEEALASALKSQETQQILIIMNALNEMWVEKLQGKGHSAFDELYISCGGEQSSATTAIPSILSGQIELYTTRHSPLAPFFLGRDVLPDPSSSESYNDIRNWLELCSKHPKCEQNFNPALPKRCLEVGLPNTPTIRLQETKGQVGNYVALSYCWGKSIGLVTTADNLAQHLQEIRLADLPATLAHAVHITRALGFQYIWIDGLCILQKRSHLVSDPVAFADWQEQASQMATVYGSASLTIAAAGAADKSEGCFIPRSPPTAPSCAIPIFATPDSDFVMARAVRPITLRRSSGKSILDSRAWCFQEGVLSQRLLIYGREELSFSCRTSTRREKLNKEALAPLAIGKVIGPRTFPELQNNPYKTGMFYLWYTILQQEFSGRSITSDSDILPALAGVALRFKHSIGARYLAGVWEADLLRGLLWKSRNILPSLAERYLNPRAVYCAPSWSWASKQGPIWYGMNVRGAKAWDKAKADNRCPVEILNVQVDLVRERDELGQVSGGFLKLRAPARDAVVVSKDVNRFQVVKRGVYASGNEWVHSYAPVGNRHLLVAVDEPNQSSPEAVGALGHFDTLEMAENITSLICLFIWEKEGLMLVPVQGGDGEDRFERVGVFTVVQRGDWLEAAQPRCVTIV